MTAIHARQVQLVADNSGSAAGSVGVPTGRYAGTYYNFLDGGSATIEVENLRRYVFQKTGATNADAVTELKPSDENLVHGDVEVSVSHATAGGTIDVVLFLDY